MSCIGEDFVDDYICCSGHEDELTLSDDEFQSSKNAITTVSSDKPTSVTVDDLWAEAIGMEIVPDVNKKIPTTTMVVSPPQSLWKQVSPAEILFPQNQTIRAAENQNQLPNCTDIESDNSNGRLNIKFNAEREIINETAVPATELQSKNSRYRRNRRNRRNRLHGDFTSVEESQNQNSYQLKFKPIRPLFSQESPLMNNQMKGSDNMWQQHCSNSSQSFVNHERNDWNNFNFNKSPFVVKTDKGNAGARTVLKNPYFEGSETLVQSVKFNGVINEHNLCQRSFNRLDVLHSGDLRNRLNKRTHASTVTKRLLETSNEEMFPKNKRNAVLVANSKNILIREELNTFEMEETQKYLLQIEQQKLQREKFLQEKELRRQRTNSEIFFLNFSPKFFIHNCELQ